MQGPLRSLQSWHAIHFIEFGWFKPAHKTNPDINSGVTESTSQWKDPQNHVTRDVDIRKGILIPFFFFLTKNLPHFLYKPDVNKFKINTYDNSVNKHFMRSKREETSSY